MFGWAWSGLGRFGLMIEGWELDRPAGLWMSGNGSGDGHEWRRYDDMGMICVVQSITAWRAPQVVSGTKLELVMLCHPVLYSRYQILQIGVLCFRLWLGEIKSGMQLKCSDQQDR